MEFRWNVRRYAAVEQRYSHNDRNRNMLWKKIIANVMNLKVDVIESEEGPGYGAAILAAVGCGAFENVERAVEKLVHVVETVEPDAELVEKYEQRYQKFKKYYPALRGLF